MTPPEEFHYSLYLQIYIGNAQTVQTKYVSNFFYSNLKHTALIKIAKSMNNLSFYLEITVKPPNKGHFGDGPVIPCREVVLFSEVFF